MNVIFHLSIIGLFCLQKSEFLPFSMAGNFLIII